ncbi:MAG: NADPH-dependent F420 reductase [Alphaproteobacteria bacterium]|nr:NADPH-dependent F420 reductase [Alphaproteobacteria bacterium]
MENRPRSVAVIGGTGDLGSGLAWRLARAGYPVVIGSRASEKAVAHAQEMARRGRLEVTGAGNVEAAASADLVIVTVPFASQQATLESIRDVVQGKIVVDTTVPLMPPKVMRVQLPVEGSAARRAQMLLGDEVRVVSAFHNVAAAHLVSEEARLEDCDVLVCGNDTAARDVVVALADAIGFKAWHAGVIDNSAVAEALTSVLIFMNRRYGIAGAGIQITGTPTKEG